MNADHEEAVEFSKISKRENRVYVGNLSYDVKYRDLMEFMRGGGWGNFSLFVIFSRILGGFFVAEAYRSVMVVVFLLGSSFQQASPTDWSFGTRSLRQESFVVERSRCFSFCLMEWSSC